MRKILVIFLLILAPTICWGYALRIGNASIPAHAEKFGMPSFNIMTDNGSVYHIPMVRKNLTNTLHVMYDNAVYSACIGTKTHVGHHWFVGDCLVGADDDVYLKIQNDVTNGYLNNIDTGVNWLDSSRVVFTVGYRHIETPPRGYEDRAMFFASSSAFPNVLGTNYITYSSGIVSLNNRAPRLLRVFPDLTCAQFKERTKQTFDINYVATGEDTIVFGSWWDEYWSRTMNWYDVVIYNGDTLLGHFIPVPAGMVIGNYTVPANGMWDVVGQKFYGNSGTGDFIYGVDE